MQTKRNGRAPIPLVVSQVIKLKANLFCFFFTADGVHSPPLQAIKISGLLLGASGGAGGFNVIMTMYLWVDGQGGGGTSSVTKKISI